jgi:hypothetical protein
MITSKIKEPAAVREKPTHLELAVKVEIRKECARLHEKYGFSGLKNF